MKTRKLLAILLTLAMMMGLLCTSAFATETTNLDVTGNTGVSSIVATTPVTADRIMKSFTTSSFQYNNQTYTNYQYTYNLALPYTATDGSTVSVTINPTSPAIPINVPPIPQFFPMIGNHGSTSHTMNATLSNGTATIVMYVHKDFANVKNWCDTYTFVFSVDYPVSISTSDPVYIAWNGGNGTVTGINGSTYIPQSFTLWAKASTITVDGVTKNYDGVDPSGSGDYYYNISTKSSGNTVMVAVVNNITYTVTCGPYTQISAGTSPKAVVSYLPIGQYATGSGWGSSTGKFANKTSLDSTGVSLGALGGYIEFDFDDPATTNTVEGITNDPRNPYGVDFVVYGNAFNGNPEAGAVQVGWENNGTVIWYELAGSRYYDDHYSFVGNQGASGKYKNAYEGTLRNTTVNYTLGTDIQVTLGSNGPNTFTTSTAWWPLTTEGYPMGTPHTNSPVTVSHSNTALSFGGVTAIQDSNVTADYAFGYADVTPNGSPSSLGDAVNPYTAYTSGKTGGDGFDLEWAVHINNGTPLTADEFYEPDSNGNPTSTLKRFRYVRIYTAVLDNGDFNETSTEVCGIFTAYRDSTETGSVGRTSAPSALSFIVKDPISGAVASSSSPTIPANRGTYSHVSTIITNATNVSANTVDVSITAAPGANVYVNSVLLSETGTSGNESVYTGTIPKPTSSQYIRVIVQAGTAEPYLFLYT